MKKIGLVKEPTFETRICFLPKEVKQLTQLLEIGFQVEKGLGERLRIPDTEYEEAGASLQSREDVLKNSDYILSINEVPDLVLDGKKNVLIGIFNMLFYPERAEKYLSKLEEVLNGSAGSTIQRNLYKKSKDFKKVIKTLMEQFYQ